MSDQLFKAVLNPQGRLTLSGPGVAALVDQTAAVELYYTKPDRGLGVRFLSEAQAKSLPVEKAGQAALHIDAAAFLDKVGFGLPEETVEPTIGQFDQARKFLPMRLA